MTSEAPTQPVLIQLDDAAISRAQAGDEISLEHVDWRICSGDYWAVTGLPGSGKTDLLHTAAGFRACLLFIEAPRTYPSPRLCRGEGGSRAATDGWGLFTVQGESPHPPRAAGRARHLPRPLGGEG